MFASFWLNSLVTTVSGDVLFSYPNMSYIVRHVCTQTCLTLKDMFG